MSIPIKDQNGLEGKKIKKARKKHLLAYVKVLGWAATTALALYSLYQTHESDAAQNVTDASQKAANLAQIQQIQALERTTPTGEITSMTANQPKGSDSRVGGLRQDPLLRQQIYDLSGVAYNVPDNGTLFVFVHDYSLGRYFINDASPGLSSGSRLDWSADNVYIGGQTPPSETLSYRVTLYFCNSVDANAINSQHALLSVLNNGLKELSYPSCRQLDSIFVRRAS
jgi:hypothetical protein